MSARKPTADRECVPLDTTERGHGEETERGGSRAKEREREIEIKMERESYHFTTFGEIFHQQHHVFFPTDHNFPFLCRSLEEGKDG